MKTLTLIMLATLMSLTSAQTFDYNWPTVYTIDILELPTVPNFLDDYSAPGQIEWNQQVYWELNSLNKLIDKYRVPNEWVVPNEKKYYIYPYEY